MSGHAGVFVRVFNETEDVVLERVTRFSYVHSEKVDDSSTLVIETNDVSIVDEENLQEGKALILVWGYMGAVTQKRKVYIWDIKPTFSKDGIRLEIQAYCKKAYTRLNSSKDVFNDTNLQDLAKSFAESYGMDVKLEGRLHEGETETTYGGKTPYQFDINSETILTARDNTALVLKKKYEFKQYKEGIPQAGKSDARLLDELADDEPVDGLFINGRDDSLLIQRRDLYQKPYKSFRYKSEPGHLLSFTPATKNSSMKKHSVANSVSGWLEDEKEYLQGGIGASHVGAGVLGDMVEMTLEQQVIQGVAKAESSPFDRPISIDGLFTHEHNGVDENGNPIYKLKAVDKLDPDGANFVYWRKRGVQPGQFVLDKAVHTAAIDNVGRIETKGFTPIDPKETIPSIESTVGNIAGVGVNRKSKNELELNEGQAEVLGDPELVSSKIITFLGLGKKYSGNYYIYHVEHSITPEAGYICNIKHYRNAFNKLGTEKNNFVDASVLGKFKNKVTALPQDGTLDLVTVPVRDDQ